MQFRVVAAQVCGCQSSTPSPQLAMHIMHDMRGQEAGKQSVRNSPIQSPLRASARVRGCASTMGYLLRCNASSCTAAGMQTASACAGRRHMQPAQACTPSYLATPPTNPHNPSAQHNGHPCKCSALHGVYGCRRPTTQGGIPASAVVPGCRAPCPLLRGKSGAPAADTRATRPHPCSR
jgi:hypothetical protein